MANQEFGWDGLVKIVFAFTYELKDALVTMNGIKLKRICYEFPSDYANWWIAEAHNNPTHVFVETVLVIFIIWLIFIRKTVDPNRESKNSKLTPKEVQWLIDTWDPDPLIKKSPESGCEVAPHNAVVI